MPKFINRARTNEAFVVYTLGIPHVSYSWSLVCPCFRSSHRVNIAYQKVKVETDYLQTADEKQIGLTSIAKFRIDAESKQKVLKAFMEFSDRDHGDDETAVDLSQMVIQKIR